jgi:Ni/Co efflux regulator RcnB
MKKFLLAAMSVSLVATPVLAAAPAQAQARHGQVVKYKPNGTVVVRQNARGNNRQAIRQQRQIARQWQRGQRFDRRYAPNYRAVNDWRAYQGRRLYAPPRGYQWVQSGNDAVLVALASGLIGAVIGGAFN